MFSLTTYLLFRDNLSSRVEKKQWISEDSVRYSFFDAVTKTTHLRQDDIILESPHPTLERKKVDTFINPTASSDAAFVEFKFHEKNASSDMAHTDNAGGLFKDFSRLAAINKSTASYFVVYFTDSQMASYFKRQNTNYAGFYSLDVGQSFEFHQNVFPSPRITFLRAMGDIYPATVTVIYLADDFPLDHELRIFQVFPKMTNTL